MGGGKEEETMSRILHIMKLLLPLVIVSCGRFEYGYDESLSSSLRPNESELSFSMVWSNGLSSAPEEMSVMMSRKINALHYLYTLDGSGRFITGDEEQKETVVSNGEYYLVAFSNKDGFYDISGYTDFGSDISLSMKNIYARLPAVAEYGDLAAEGMMDFNPYSGYVDEAEEPLYLYIDKNLRFPLSSGRVVMNPEDATRTLTVRMTVEAEEGVSVGRIVGILSGVPVKIQLMSGLVSGTETAKVMFEFVRKYSKGGRDVYEGKVRVLGLFPSPDKSLVTGPGILQVSMFAGVEHEDTVVERVFYAGINLKEVIEESGLMVQSEDKTGYSVIPQREIGNLTVDTVLKIMKNHVEAGESDGRSDWFENDADISPEV